MAIKREYLIQRDGKTFALYAGLLDAAHELGLRAITTVMVQLPSELNGQVTICQATVELADSVTGTLRTFQGIGDAGPGNVTRMMAPHAIRMAETRAKARALRDAVNVAEAIADDATSAHDEGLEGREQDSQRRQERQERQAYGELPLPSPDDDEPRLAAASVRYAPRPTQGSMDALTGGATGGAAAGPPAGAAWGAAGPAGGPGGPGGLGGGGGAGATPKQLDTIARMARAAGKNVDTDGLSRGQASAIIQSLIEGIPA